jgi:aspartyl-tRNA(Asn)/glutamyl-tRNA(Gln) amidotransferase subunit C
MSIDRATVRNIAQLARLEVHDDELDPLAAELSNIMNFIEQLSEVNTEGVAPMASVLDFPMPRREDKVTDGARADDILANAPEQEDGFFLVPKVVE